MTEVNTVPGNVKMSTRKKHIKEKMARCMEKQLPKSRKKLQVKLLKKLWKNRGEDITAKSIKSKEKYKQKNGCYPGWTEEAREKRKQTFIEKCGKEHSWKGEYGERQCDKTTVEKYGKSSHMMMIEAGIKAQSNKDTGIENKVENILQENNIDYKKQIWIEDFRPDFFLPNHNLIIEADGDYWYGHPKKYDELDEIQQRTKEKDKQKEEYFAQSEYELERFWGSEIRSEKFETKIINSIQQYE